MTTIELDTYERPMKKSKPSTTTKEPYCIYRGYWRFSHEILCLIFQHLDNKDLMNLSRVNIFFRYLLKPYIFNEVSVSWEMIISYFPNKTELVYDPELILKRISPYIETIRISQPNLSNEWSFRFHRLFNKFNNLKELKVNVSSSSNFLKYNEFMPNLRKLELKTYGDSDTSVFNLNHLRMSPNINKLTIDGFCIDFTEEDLVGLKFCIKELNLINCSWNYPFQLANFGNSQIEHMKLLYTNQFILSERFREFLHNPNLPNLKYMTISNQNSLRLHITYQIFNFLQNIPNLKRLYLIGNIYNETLNHFTEVDLQNRLRYCLNINDVKIFYSSFVQNL